MPIFVSWGIMPICITAIKKRPHPSMKIIKYKSENVHKLSVLKLSEKLTVGSGMHLAATQLKYRVFESLTAFIFKRTFIFFLFKAETMLFRYPTAYQ